MQIFSLSFIAYSHIRWASQVAQWYRIYLPMQQLQDIRVQSLGGQDPLEKEMATHFSILAWKLHGQRSLVGYSPWGHKELNTTEETEHIYMHSY